MHARNRWALLFSPLAAYPFFAFMGLAAELVYEYYPPDEDARLRTATLATVYCAIWLLNLSACLRWRLWGAGALYLAHWVLMGQLFLALQLNVQGRGIPGLLYLLFLPLSGFSDSPLWGAAALGGMTLLGVANLVYLHARTD